jgi:anti-anti-sigma factor
VFSGSSGGPLAPLALEDNKLSSHLLFDLTDATFLDSSGIGWLLSVNRAAKELGYQVIVYSVPPLIQRVFGMMKLGEVIPVVDNLDEARNRIASVS